MHRMNLIEYANKTSVAMVKVLLGRGYAMHVKYQPDGGGVEYACYTFFKDEPVAYEIAISQKVKDGIPYKWRNVYASVPVLQGFGFFFGHSAGWVAKWEGDEGSLEAIVAKVEDEVARVATEEISLKAVFDSFEHETLQATTVVKQTDTGIVFAPVFKNPLNDKILYVHATYLEDPYGVRYPVRTVIDLAKALRTLLQVPS